MTPDEAKAIIELLLEGVNPVTCKAISRDSVLDEPEVLRALFIASNALSGSFSSRSSGAKPRRSGEPWGDDEDDKLLRAVEEGVSIDALAIEHQRSIGAITSRLAKYDRVPTSHNMSVEETNSELVDEESITAQ